MDPIVLARVQFALTASFHFVFPSISIGLGLVVAILEVARWRTRRDVWDRAARFWTQLFALTFVVGVATGIVMEFQFGTNWSRYSTFVGDIFGSPLAAEAHPRLLPRIDLPRACSSSAATGSGPACVPSPRCMVAFGAAMSGFWIIVANSWMQTPAGFEMQGDKAVLTDFFAALFNPSVLPRFAHTIASSWALAGFIVMAVGAWYIRRGRTGDVARVSLRVGPPGGRSSGRSRSSGPATSTPARSPRRSRRSSPRCRASTRRSAGAPLVIWSLPPAQDPANAVEGPAVQVTHLLSFLTFGSFTAPITGLETFPPADWPPVAATFLAYHNMVLLGTLMAVLLVAGGYLAWRRRLEASPRWLQAATWAVRPAVPRDPARLGHRRGRPPAVDRPGPDADVRRHVADRQRAGDPFSILLFSAIYVLLAGLWLFLVRRAISRARSATRPDSRSRRPSPRRGRPDPWRPTDMPDPR